ncbi:ribosome small subunit-dependent GTPase A, partial [Schaalia georgiae]
DRVVAVRAKEIRRGGVIMGDRVRLAGDLSGAPGALARIVRVEERSTVLRRSLEDAPDARGEKAIVANASLMCVVVALADPPPRTGMIDRCLVAAYEAGLRPVLVLTKSDLADPGPLVGAYADFDLDVVVTGGGGASGADRLAEALRGEFSVLVGHSGVGKSTLINALSPDADRAVGSVNGVTGRGRHTSTSSEAFELPGGGWIVDTPGVRSFGLGHVGSGDVLAVFPDVRDAASWCLPMCTHAESEPSCALDAFARGEAPFGAGGDGAEGLAEEPGSGGAAPDGAGDGEAAPGPGVLARRASRV